MIHKLFFNRKNQTVVLIVLTVFIAAFLRFYNLNWDLGNYFHPDERNIDNAVIGIKFFTQLDPKFFAYGGFTIYLYRIVADALYFITHDQSWVSNWPNINIIGRFFSAFFSTFTIIPLYFIAKKIADKKTAILTIVLYAFTVTSIQTAHYAVTESLITLIGVTICLFSLKILKNINLLNILILSIISGIGIASKTSAISFLIMPFIVFFMLLIRKNNLRINLIYFFLYIITTFTVFTIFSPYTFIDWSKFIESMNYESGVATGTLPVVYTLQFDHTFPFLFQLFNLFWQIGIDAIFCILGFIFVLYEVIKKKNKELLVFVIFPLIYFYYVGSWHTKFIRYMVPITPFLLITGSMLLTKLRQKYRKLGNAIIFLAVILTIIWGFAFFSIYTRPQTRITASEWIYKHVPSNSKLLNEQWDDGLPVTINKFTPLQYQITSLAMYDPDNSSKVDYLSQNLSNADYIIFNSRRLYGTLIRLTDKYPITSKYYQLLFEGKLGYKIVAEFTSYPSILGLNINDDASEETFQVYDHPKVIILKNENKYNSEKLKELLSLN